MGKGIITPEAITLQVVFGCLMGAITWNMITWYLVMPTSSSHALIGGLMGAAVPSFGTGAILPWLLSHSSIYYRCPNDWVLFLVLVFIQQCENMFPM
jgi:PiT family inorganic phosphate transporter